MKIIDKLNKLTESSVDIESKDYRSGHWINPLNGQWISKRVYVKVKDGNDGVSAGLTLGF